MTGEEADALLGSEEDVSGDEDGGKGGAGGGGSTGGAGGAGSKGNKKGDFLRDDGVRRKGPPPGAAAATAQGAGTAANAASTPPPATTVATAMAAAKAAAAAVADAAAAAAAMAADDMDDTVAVLTTSIGPTARPASAPASWELPTRAGKRTLGPMVPPRAMLEAAAAEMALEAAGPAPPEIIEEVELTGAAAREAAAKRVLKTAANAGDAYDILNVSPEDVAGVVKKAFWKLSLMVHPDKCDHPHAADAFDLVKKAHTCLADPSERSIIDGAREERTHREGFNEWLAEERQKAAWRKLQGEPLPGDDDLVNGPEQAEEQEGRGEWMTVLPKQMKPKAGGHTTSVTSFAAKTFVERDAATIADWTDTPKDQATREARLFLAAQEERYALPAVQAAAQAATAKEHEVLVDDFNQKRRARTLLEQHQERQEKETKAGKAREKAERKAKRQKTKDAGDAGGAGGDAVDGTGWAYKPWNRETDLEAGRGSSAITPDDMLKKAGGDLKGRFGGNKSTGGGRNFL